LVFPAHLNGIDPALESAFVGVALLNTAATDNAVTITAIDSLGNEQLVKNPVFGPSVQEAFLAASLGSTGTQVAFKAKGAGEGLRGFFLVGDGRPDRLDGVGGKLPAATSLVFPIAAQSTDAKTVLFLTNPSGSQTADLTLRLVDRDGQAVQTASLSLAPGASRLAALNQLMPAAGIAGDSFLRLDANTAVQGFELLADQNEFSSASAQQSIPAATALWIPHFVLGVNGEDTEIRLVNVESQPVTARLKVYDDSANLLTTRDFSIPAGGLFVDWLSNLLGLTVVPPSQPYISGHMVIDILNPGAGVGILGTATFTGPQRKARSTLPMWRQPHVDSLYLQVAQSTAQDVFTGLAIMNPNPTAVSVTVRVFTNEGHLAGERTLQIEPGQRVVDLLNGVRFFGPAFEQTGGHLTVAGDQPIVSFVVFGDSQSRWFSAVEGQ